MSSPFTLLGSDSQLILDDKGGLTLDVDGRFYLLRAVGAGQIESRPAGHYIGIDTLAIRQYLRRHTAGHITITANAAWGSLAWVSGKLPRKFEVLVYGGQNTVFSLSKMMFVAPFQGLIGGCWRSAHPSVITSGVRAQPLRPDSEFTEQGIFILTHIDLDNIHFLFGELAAWVVACLKDLSLQILKRKTVRSMVKSLSPLMIEYGDLI